ncbi:MAG TPA: hypothetical protein PKJ39_03515 [Caldisericia bacterium]|nr:hypothetical protein [Caldisericia bacterium]HQP00608.1 hypothetical protein [Caldisericia bacterium]
MINFYFLRKYYFVQIKIIIIEKDVILSYQWGWTIVMFIESSYGKEMILKIVRECYNGNIFEIVSENIKIFKKRWKEWLLKNWKNSIYFI